jgi:hypothetical protein
MPLQQRSKLDTSACPDGGRLTVKKAIPFESFSSPLAQRATV